jgi:hypothetical protein
MLTDHKRDPFQNVWFLLPHRSKLSLFHFRNAYKTVEGRRDSAGVLWLCMKTGYPALFQNRKTYNTLSQDGRSGVRGVM